MDLSKYRIKEIFKKLLFFLIVAVIFSLAYRQAPLYVSNQNTKFLHGLAQAGYGSLNNDWTANTIDPLPVFSFLVFVTYKFMHEYFFYLFYIIILGIFIVSLYKISDFLFNLNDSFLKKILFLAILISFHSTIFDSLTYHIFGFSFEELLIEEGVAMQYLLGSYLQPCVFGVFLLFAIYLFLSKKYYFAVFSLIIASYIHSAYLFSSGMLTLCFMIIMYIDKKGIKVPILIGLFAFILILPILIYNFIYLGPTSPELEKQALDILVNLRIPHHSDPALWFDFSVVVKMLIISLAIIIVRRSKLFLIILLPFLVAIISTIIYLFIKIDFLGLLAPWRMSVWLLPLSASIIIGYLVKFIFSKFNSFILKYNNSVSFIFMFILLLHVSYGLYGTTRQFKEYLNNHNGQMMDFIKKNNSPDDVYLVPTNMQNFRLDTGVPVFVSHKTHPYKDVEVIEWYDRIKLAEAFYNGNYDDKKNVLKQIREKDKVTHIVIRSNSNLEYKDILEKYYSDEDYTVYKIK